MRLFKPLLAAAAVLCLAAPAASAFADQPVNGAIAAHQGLAPDHAVYRSGPRLRLERVNWRHHHWRHHHWHRHFWRHHPR